QPRDSLELCAASPIHPDHGIDLPRSVASLYSTGVCFCHTKSHQSDPFLLGLLHLEPREEYINAPLERTARLANTSMEPPATGVLRGELRQQRSGLLVARCHSCLLFNQKVPISSATYDGRSNKIMDHFQAQQKEPFFTVPLSQYTGPYLCGR